ncbi:cysteine-rich RLK (RECEPTOR-like protein kinase) 42 [Hibiscus trionum]|uniref:Cysteine-rich RLK (RECEPTOR-like protein kinase) 42 n=1 Tax=Hibiscus trionum TaxID=183268 RepID=A0A9W7IGK9_HIBTR|nr:cysteine-rich RLK (RECEPTOR-like protein kinase) 42 [Hibiscus trionum]
MRLPIPDPWNITIWVFFVSCSCFFVPCLSFDARIICGSDNVTSNTFAQQVDKAMESLSGLVGSQNWGTVLNKDQRFNVFGFAQCYEDVTPNDCRQCFRTSRDKLKQCLPARSARIHLDQCFNRFDHYQFYDEGVDPSYDYVQCGSPRGDFNDTYMCQDFQSKLDHVIMNVKNEAMGKSRFGAAEVKGGVVTVYALAQCWKTVDTNACKQCLTDAGMRLRKCSPGAEGRALYTGCYMRYSTNRFFDNGSKAEEEKGFIDWVTFGMALSVISFLLLSVIVALVSYKKLSTMKQGVNGLEDVQATGSKTSLNFKYEMLERATECFDESRKLGQGGAGSVFKGILPNGEAVAVKRLFFNTRQWVDQFFNEVTLISGIQHKNLVRLLGCSIEGPESLLIYEYVPNRSLDQILFAKDSRTILSWSERFNIICGISEGLAYLHGVKILHRDIKSSNILLDENLCPKIADFGLARCVASDKSHVSTAIAGTLGYMAPEYLVRGQLTEKADVYAFGVLVLEISTGRKNSVFSEGSSSILYRVWKQYKANNITQAIDSGLEGKFDEKEASTALQVGLLCTQASVAIRPSMSEVVQMLTTAKYEIPRPKQPPFLNASVISPEQTLSGSFMMGSSALDEPNG